MAKKKLEMRFDPKTIEHLGIHQYSTLPPVIAELVSNSYDAEAKIVTIYLNDLKDKEIIIKDNGHGMTFDEINDNFLLIGRNRRIAENTQKSKNGKRFVIGKKGIGKLSFFGIAEKIEVKTIQDYNKNVFLLSWKDLKIAGEKSKPYMPKVLKRNVNSVQKQGTTVTLREIKRKTSFVPIDLAYALSMYFTVFDEPDFKVKIIHNNEKAILVTNKLKFEGMSKLLTWSFPRKLKGLKTSYEYSNKITGEVIAAKETVRSSLKGVALFSRGKLVNEHSFYDLKASSFGYDYITGWLNIDFIDDWNKEVISTNRKSLIWEDEDASDLQKYLQEMLPLFYNEQRLLRETEVRKDFEKKTGINLGEWQNSLPKNEKKLAGKIITSIFNSEIEPDRQTELIKYVKDSFHFEAFREMALDIDQSMENPEKLLEFLKEWKMIEAREFYKLSIVRIETIKKFKNHIKKNALEVPVMHEFLAKFSWLLDPRLLNFRDEITYSDLLRNKFKETKNNKSDRRLDFLCHQFADSFFIIELKRPETIISDSELDQGLDYVSFIRSKLSNEYGKSIYCYIVGKKLAQSERVKLKAESYREKHVVYFKPYEELLSAAISYHQEFIDRYNELEKEKFKKF